MLKKNPKSRKNIVENVRLTNSNRWMFLVVIALLVAFLPVQNGYAQRASFEALQIQSILIPPSPAPFAINLHTSDSPDLTAESIMITDVTSGMVLYKKNEHQRLFPASITKIMTALITLDNYKLDDVVTVENVAAEGQVMGLKPQETITVENLLYGILVHSANDAAIVLANHHPQKYAGFINEMNQKVIELHMQDTHFTNPSGLDDPQHYSTSYDIALLSLYALKNPIISKMVGVPSITVSDTNYTTFHSLKNVNELLGKIPGVSGFKTGFTQVAGQSLVTRIQRHDHTILIVILKSTDRFKETENLVDWVFANFSWKDLQVEERK